jgi:hypothetical protein
MSLTLLFAQTSYLQANNEIKKRQQSYDEGAQQQY